MSVQARQTQTPGFFSPEDKQIIGLIILYGTLSFWAVALPILIFQNRANIRTWWMERRRRRQIWGCEVNVDGISGNLGSGDIVKRSEESIHDIPEDERVQMDLSTRVSGNSPPDHRN
ncbi:uncharacterized protein LY89DRAFT_677751 [Mollisia scopiformis]|uniref:Uncharacterized protein n=1 Tax=Mollisia scopiformis TaxID=149040 RepID=A0A132B774_MOLSC|nr:uncharacterized protein LY89DRAFT_677751 [Mollisia scopiformis]KUJ07527.1 hypothetical protein LY89DRAFT_677751 [Mollisia scopiformis]